MATKVNPIIQTWKDNKDEDMRKEFVELFLTCYNVKICMCLIERGSCCIRDYPDEEEATDKDE